MGEERVMTVAKLVEHLGRFPQDAEVVDLDVSVVIDADANLVQSLSLWENDGPDDDARRPRARGSAGRPRPQGRQPVAAAIQALTIRP